MMEKSLRWVLTLIVPMLVAGATGYVSASRIAAQAAIETERRIVTLEVHVEDTAVKINQQMKGYDSMMTAFKEWYRDSTEKELSSIDKRLARIETAMDAQRGGRPR